MIAGGLGTIAPTRPTRSSFPAGTLLVQLGGPGMRIGMGGGAASSMAAGANAADARLRLGAARQPRDPAPRAGGHQPLLGARRAQPDPGDPRRRRRRPVQRLPRAGRRRRPRRPFDLRAVPLEESGLAPKEIWCNESQERYVSRWRRSRCRCSPRSASASAARTPSSASRPTRRELVARRSTGRRRARRAPRRSTCRWRCCSASRRRCTATCAARRASARRRSTSTDVDARRRSRFDVLRHPTVASKRFLSRSATAPSAA